MDLALDAAGAATEADPAAPWSAWTARSALVLAVAGSALLLWGLSFPFSDLGSLLLGVLTLGAAGIVWCAAVVLVAIDSLRDRPLPPMRWIGASMGVVLVVCVVAGLEVPWKLRWADSRPDFAAAVAEAEADGGSSGYREISGPRRVGSIDVQWIRQQGDAVIFRTDGTLLGSAGLLHRRSGSETLIQIDGALATQTPIGGGWYRWTSVGD